MHWRTGVDKNFSSLKFKIWRRKKQFSEGEKNVALSCLLILKNTLGQLPRFFAGTLLLPLCPPPETDLQILERWGCAYEVQPGKYVRTKDFGVEF